MNSWSCSHFSHRDLGLLHAGAKVGPVYGGAVLEAALFPLLKGCRSIKERTLPALSPSTVSLSP